MYNNQNIFFMQKYQKCTSNFPAAYICVSKNCQEHAFICDNLQCCTKEKHNSCTIQLVDSFNQLLGSGQKDYQLYVAKINNFYNTLFEQIKLHREEFLQYTKNYEQVYRKLVHLKSQKPNIKFDGNDANHLFGAWSLCTYDFTKQSQTEMDKIQSNIIKDLNTIKKFYTLNLKKVQEQRRSSANQPLDINSSILWRDEDQNTLLRFFLNENRIRQIKCLYRASNNNFSVAKFHELCDGIPNTLTLIRNSKDIIIGGFSAPSWEQNQFGKYKPDPNGKSFIFSITNDEKFPLFQKDYAIQCNKFCGPIFGRGSAVWIYDKADANSAYWHIIPSTYHPSNEQWTQSTYQAFLGMKMYQNFTITEWEVFEIIFQS